MGHTISKDGVAASKTKIQAILDIPTPQNKNYIQRLLGMLTY